MIKFFSGLSLYVFLTLFTFQQFCFAQGAQKKDLPLPDGMADVWKMEAAWRQSSPTRERICINGLWRFLPVSERIDMKTPGENEGWGWFKVPGIWPNEATGGAQEVLLSDYIRDKLKKVNAKFDAVDQAWYKREIVIPENWSGRRVVIYFTMVQTHARVYMDGNEAGEVWFPGGKLDITEKIKHGRKQNLHILLTARPLDEVTKHFAAADRMFTSKAKLRSRGLTGDVFIVGEPKEDTLEIGLIITSTRKKKISINTRIANPGKGKRQLEAKILDGNKVVKSFRSDVFNASSLEDGTISFSASWKNAKLWDTNTTENMYDAVVTLYDNKGKILDTSLPEKFGFREFWIDGRDFYLNGKRIHLRATRAGNVSGRADTSCFESSLITCDRAREYGFNLLTLSHRFNPGSIGYMDGMLKACDEKGMLTTFGLPHESEYNKELHKPEKQEQYRKLTKWIVGRVGNHPSVVLYSMNFNATGYYGDQNPLKIDGIYVPDRDPDIRTHYHQAMITAKIAKELDPTRIPYHHSSGNLDTMHTINNYLNWVPIQERCDWIEHWATVGVKPVFLVEYGFPHVASWSSYRGPEFIHRSFVFQQIWDSEFTAPYLGQEAYRMTPVKVGVVEREESYWAKGEPFHLSWLIRELRRAEELIRIQGLFCRGIWPSFRTWGLSAVLPFDMGNFWKSVGESKPMEVTTKHEDLQKPGIVPDRIRSGSYLNSRDKSLYEPTSIGKAFLRYNMPLLAYIGGGPDRFSEKGHNFFPGNTIKKNAVIVNDAREEVTCSFRWQLTPGNIKGSGKAKVKPGDKGLVPINISLPKDITPGHYTLSATFDLGNGEIQEDSFGIDIIPNEETVKLFSKVALFDPKGMTAKLFDSLGVNYDNINADAPLDGYDILVIGREAITDKNNLTDLDKLKEGLKVLIFEQTADVLERRLGFRINIYGTRDAFIRATSHPVLKDLTEETMHDWQGASTLIPPYLEDVDYYEYSDPKWYWCNFENTRAWRCQNHGNVCSVLIEKPPRGNWLPIIDCAFDLQYSPLLEYTEGKGRAIFCQLNVTGRTREDPAARKICVNLLNYLDKVKPASKRKVLYEGNKQGIDLLNNLNIPFEEYSNQSLDRNTLLVAGPGTEPVPGLKAGLQEGLNVLCLGLNSSELDKILPGKVKVKRSRTIPAFIKKFDAPEVSGISNAELHWRTILELPAIEKTTETSNEALKVISVRRGKVVLCQAAPWMFDYVKKPYLRTTYRRNLFLVSRLLHNLGASSSAPLAELWKHKPAINSCTLLEGWIGKVDKKGVGRAKRWWKVDFDDSNWKKITVPGAFDIQFKELAGYLGLFWYRLKFEVPEGLSKDKLILHVGAVDDESWIWLNGKFLGEVTPETNPKDFWRADRTYEVEPGLLKRDGENTLVVCAKDTNDEGGIMGRPRIYAPEDGAWLKSYYVQEPEKDDDPYRYYRW